MLKFLDIFKIILFEGKIKKLLDDRSQVNFTIN